MTQFSRFGELQYWPKWKKTAKILSGITMTLTLTRDFDLSGEESLYVHVGDLLSFTPAHLNFIHTANIRLQCWSNVEKMAKKLSDMTLTLAILDDFDLAIEGPWAIIKRMLYRMLLYI